MDYTSVESDPVSGAMREIGQVAKSILPRCPMQSAHLPVILASVALAISCA